MNTLDSILPELRSLLPASLRGAYLDGYLQRRRTPMELLLSRSLPNVDVAASTFEDLRAEIRSLGLPLWVANRYLAEAEQALAIGHDTREVIAAAKAWLATKPENPPEADVSCHVCSETGKKSCTACGTEIIPYGAHGDSCPRCAEQEINMPIASEAATPNRAVTIADQFERLFGLGERRPTSELLIPGKTEDLSGFSRSVVYWPKTFKRPHFTLVLRASSSSTPKQLLALGRKALAWFAKMRGRPASSPGGPETETIIAVEWMTSSVVVTKLAGGLGVIRMPGEEPRLSLLADAHDWRAAFAAEPGRNVAPETHDASAAPIDRFMAAYEPALYDALKEHPEEYAFTAAEVPTFLPQWRHALLTQDFNHHGYAIRGACKKLGIKCTKKALLAFLRPGATLPEPREVRSSAKRPSLPDPVLTRRSEVAFRSEADALADIFNEGATWQAEATNPNMVGKWHAPGVRLSIFSEARGPGNVVAIATIDDNDVDVEWLSAGLSEATRNEITRRLRTAALTQSEDSEAPSPLQDLIESTEKRALELGAKPARTRSFGRVTSDNADEKRLAEALRDLRDPTEISESIKWLEDQDLGIGFDIDDRLSEMDSVSSLLEEIWTPILDTIGMEGVSTQNMRGRDRILSVATGAVFRDGAPFLLQRLIQQGRPTLRKVMIEIVEDSSDEDVTSFIDTGKVMTVGREQGSIGPMVHSSEQRGASFIGLLYQYMARLREDLERAPKVLSDVRRLLYWTGAMLDAPRCQDETKRRAMESFEAAKALYDEARTRVTTQSTTSSVIASIKTPLRKAAVSAAQLATDCGEGQVDIFSVRPQLPLPQAPAFVPPGFGLDPGTTPPLDRQTADVSGMATRERYRQQVQAIGLPFDEENVLMTAVDRALLFGQDADAIMAQRLPSVDEMPSRWMSGDHVIGPNGENGTIMRLEDRGEYGWHLKLDRPPSAHWQSAVGFRRVSGQSHEPPPVPAESPETPLHEQDRNSVDVLDRLVAALSEVFIVTPIRSGHGYRVVDLRSSVDFGVYKGLPRNTYLTTVSLRHSGPSEIIGDKAYLVQATREAGLSHDQYRAIRQFVAETVERLTDEAQGKAPPEPEMPDDGEVTTKTFATRMPTKYLRDFFAEKDIPEQHWTLQDSSGMEHHISNLVVVEHIAQTNKTEADAIANTLRRLDFANQDINGYLKHLAHALIEHKVSSVQDTQDPPVTPASELRMSINHVASVSRR